MKTFPITLLVNLSSESSIFGIIAHFGNLVAGDIGEYATTEQRQWQLQGILEIVPLYLGIFYPG